MSKVIAIETFFSIKEYAPDFFDELVDPYQVGNDDYADECVYLTIEQFIENSSFKGQVLIDMIILGFSWREVVYRVSSLHDEKETQLGKAFTKGWTAGHKGATQQQTAQLKTKIAHLTACNVRMKAVLAR